MTSFDAVTSAGMNELPPFQRAGGGAKYPYGHPNPWQALLARQASSEAQVLFLGVLGGVVHRLPGRSTQLFSCASKSLVLP